MTIFAKRLKKLREDKGLTQQDLADIVGTTNKAISTWEQGIKVPRQPRVEKLADYFNVTTDYLLGRTDIKQWNEWDEKCNTDDIRNQSHILETMQRIMPDVYELLMEYNDLNEDGKKEAILRVRELGFLPQYKKDENE